VGYTKWFSHDHYLNITKSIKPIYMCTLKTATGILITGLLLSCQSQNTGQETTSYQEAVVVEAGQSAVTDDVSEKDIVKVAANSPDHTTLVQAVKAADLVNALSNAGPFTVFAPTNDAFKKLPVGALEDLTKPENLSKLQDVLQYHVSIGVFKAEDFTDGQTIGQANGGKITLQVKDGKVNVNGQGNIMASIKASNGIIHVIDGVLQSK
jgi:uncharacterized surface protein with fasciclin (FAS1) repeats